MKSISAIHPAITENAKNSLVNRMPHILIHESHNAPISAMSNSYHNIISMRGTSAIFIFHTDASHYESTANCYLYMVVKQEWGTKGCTKVAPSL